MRILAIFFFFLLTNTGLAAQDFDFIDWDTDADGLIERQEFANKFVEDIFTNWDQQKDVGMIEDDYFARSYLGLDSDGDNLLSDQEWMVGYNYFYDTYVVHSDMQIYDTNDNGFIDYAEYYDVLYDTPYYAEIDVDNDGFLSEYELAYYVFDEWDFDDSYTISRSEYNAFDWYYLDI
jgi:hypothetical protein